jgi:hypothetical protein
MNRNPSTPAEALQLVDDLFQFIVPNWSKAYRIVIELQPGLSGRPAGSGVPSGGRGAATDDDDPNTLGPCTVVERAALAGSPERQLLVDLEQLPARVEADVVRLVWSLQSADRVLRAPAHATVGQRLAWSNWAIRQMLAMHHARILARRMSPHAVDRLHADTDRLHQLVAGLVEPARLHADPDRRDLGLAVDQSGMWCRSCLRAGGREPRSDRYAEQVCRWCGDFHAEQGWWPTIDLLEARHSGKRITEQMIGQARPTKRTRKKTRR